MICLLMLWSLAASGARADEPRPPDDWEQAGACFEKQDYAGAARHLDALIAAVAPAEVADPVARKSVRFRWRYSHLGPIYLARADALVCQGKWDAGLADCTLAAELIATDPDLNRIKGDCHLGRGEFGPAIAAFDAAIDALPREVYSYYGRAIARLMLHQYDEALADLDALWALEPSPKILQLRAAVQMCRRDDGRALTDLDEAARLAPQDPEVLSFRAVARLGVGRLDDALADADAAVALDPRRAMARVNRGAVHQRRREYAAAIADATEAIRLDPKWAGRYYENRAASRIGLGDTAGALADLDLAATTRPDDPKLDAARASVLATAADPKFRDGKAALALASRAAERTHRADAGALTALAEAHAALGDFPRAIEAADATLQLPPADPIDWRVDAIVGNQLRVGFWISNVDPARTRRDLEAALARYRAGKP